MHWVILNLNAQIQASLTAQLGKNLPAMQETQVQFLVWDDPLEKEMATHSSILAWRISWTEEPGGLQSTGSRDQTWLIDQTTTSSAQIISILVSSDVWINRNTIPMGDGFIFKLPGFGLRFLFCNMMWTAPTVIETVSYITCVSCLYSVVHQNPVQLFHPDFHTLKLIIKIEWAVSGSRTAFIRGTVTSPPSVPFYSRRTDGCQVGAHPSPGTSQLASITLICWGDWMNLRMWNCLVRSNTVVTSSGSLLWALSPAL